MNIKKYTKVVRMGHKTTRGFLNEGDAIVIQEKIDGANASFKVEDGKIRCFSRNQELDGTTNNTLRGFYQWVHDNIKPEQLWEGVIYFGEWLVSHKVQYPQDKYYNFYLFDIFDEGMQQYLPFNTVMSEAELLELNVVPLLYVGKYESYEQLMEFVGKTEMGGEFGEGIVVKKVFDTSMYVKLVGDEFAEMMPQAKKPKKPMEISAEYNLVETFLTKARVEKMLHKLVDEGIVDEHFDLTDMGTILKTLGNRIFDDIVEEEGDSLPENYDEKQIRKGVGRYLANIVKGIITEKR